MFSYFRHIKRGGNLGQTTPESERLARFLLRRLPADEAGAIAARLFEDEGLVAEMEAVERDLLDAYANGRLSKSDQRDVDVHLMTLEQQREKLRFAFALSRQHRVRQRTNSMLWAAAAVLLLSLAGGAAWIARLAAENRGLRSELATLRKEGARVEDAPAIAFLLSPVDRSPGEVRLETGVNVALVRLNLVTETDAGGKCDVRVRTASGAMVMEQQGVTVQPVAGAAYLSIWLPNTALPPGSYTVSVTDAQGHEYTYSFRMILHK
jgi:hypothetical protein